MRIAATAEADFEAILEWTLGQFGNAQVGLYAETLSLAVEALTAGPAQSGVRARPEIGKGMFTLHVAREGRRGRHFVLFRAEANPTHPRIDVLRILHDSMDLARHVPEDK